MECALIEGLAAATGFGGILTVLLVLYTFDWAKKPLKKLVLPVVVITLGIFCMGLASGLDRFRAAQCVEDAD